LGLAEREGLFSMIPEMGGFKPKKMGPHTVAFFISLAFRKAEKLFSGFRK